MAKTINFDKPKAYSKRRMEAGDLIQFLYNGKHRLGIIISPKWKNNCDCYVFDSFRDIPVGLLEYIRDNKVDSGDLYVDFGMKYQLKSFNIKNIRYISKIEFQVLDEEKEESFEDIELYETVSDSINIDKGTMYE